MIVYHIFVAEADPRGSVIKIMGKRGFEEQHDPEILPGGNILAASRGRPERAAEIDSKCVMVNRASGLSVAERLRQVIEAAEMRELRGNVFGITVSQGLCSYKLGDDVYSLISRTDNALYRAKQRGRNRVEAAT